MSEVMEESDKPHEINAYSLKNISNDVIGVMDALEFEKQYWLDMIGVHQLCIQLLY